MTLQEYCDHGHCPAEARFEILTRTGPLYLCGHHLRDSADALQRLEADVFDLQTGQPANRGDAYRARVA